MWRREREGGMFKREEKLRRMVHCMRRKKSKVRKKLLGEERGIGGRLIYREREERKPKGR